MASKEKSSVLEVDDSAVPRKTAATRPLFGMMALMLVILMLMVMVVSLHVRLNKLEQCQCIAEPTRSLFVTSTSEDDEDVIDKVRTPLSDSNTGTVRQRRSLAGFLQFAKLAWPIQ